MNIKSKIILNRFNRATSKALLGMFIFMSSNAYSYNVPKEGDFKIVQEEMVAHVDSKIDEHSEVRRIVFQLERMKECLESSETLEHLDLCRWGRR